jgi:hypothetical protein
MNNKTSAIDWASVDWDKRNDELAAELLLSKKTISVYRQTHGRPRVKSVKVDWSAVEWKYSDHYLAGWLNVCVERIRVKRAEVGKPIPARALRTLGVDEGVSDKKQLVDRMSVDWSKTDAELVKLLCRDIKTIKQRRLHGGKKPTKSRVRK